MRLAGKEKKGALFWRKGKAFDPSQVREKENNVLL